MLTEEKDDVSEEEDDDHNKEEEEKDGWPGAEDRKKNVPEEDMGGTSPAPRWPCQRLDGRGHGVGGVHPAARGRPGAAVLDDLPALGVRDLVVEVLAVELEGDDDVEGLPHGGPRPGADGPRRRWSRRTP